MSPTIAICDPYRNRYPRAAELLLSFMVLKAKGLGLKPVPERVRLLHFQAPLQTDEMSCGYFVLQYAQQLCERFDDIYQWCVATAPKRQHEHKINEAWYFVSQENLRDELHAVYEDIYRRRLQS